MSTATVSVQHQTQTQPYRSTGSTSGGYHQPYHYPQEQHQYQAQDQQQHQQQQQHQHLQQTKREDLEEQGSRGAMTYEINQEPAFPVHATTAATHQPIPPIVYTTPYQQHRDPHQLYSRPSIPQSEPQQMAPHSTPGLGGYGDDGVKKRQRMEYGSATASGEGSAGYQHQQQINTPGLHAQPHPGMSYTGGSQGQESSAPMTATTTYSSGPGLLSTGGASAGDQQQQHLPTLPSPHGMAYPTSAASANYPSHVPHLNQPVQHAPSSYMSSSSTFPPPLPVSHSFPPPRYHHEATAYALPQGYYANMPNSVNTYPGSGSTSAQDFSPVLPGSQSAGMTSGNYVGHQDAYSGPAGSSSGWSHAYTHTGQPYVVPLSAPPYGRGMQMAHPGEPMDDRRRAKFSSESSSMASPVYSTGTDNYHAYQHHVGRPEVVDSTAGSDPAGQSQGASSSTKLSSSTVSASGKAATSGKSKRKTSGSANHGGGKNQPVFVTKLYNMLEDPAIARTGLLKWSADGAGFVCTDPTEFARSVLPQYFKHNNWHSFVRQLNMYGFSKQVNDVFLTLTTPSAVPVAWEFRHATFRRDDPDGIATIKRRSVKQTNQLRLQMEAEAAARQENRAAHAGIPLHLHPAAMYAHESKPMVHEQTGRPSTSSPGLSSMSSMSPQYPPTKYGQPTGQHPSGHPMPYPASYPRYPSYMPTPNPAFDGFRPPLDPLQQQPLSSASAVSQFPVLQNAGVPPGYQAPLSGNSTREHAYSLARHVGSISDQASHLAYEQEALRHNAEELRQETGVILESLSSGSDQALADNQAFRVRQGIERLQNKFEEREKRVQASLANAENIVATAHALKGSLAAAVPPLHSDKFVVNIARGTHYTDSSNPARVAPGDWSGMNGHTLPPMQNPHYETSQRYRTRPNMQVNHTSNQHINHEMSQENDRSDSEGMDGSEKSRPRSGSGSGGIKELLN